MFFGLDVSAFWLNVGARVCLSIRLCVCVLKSLEKMLLLVKGPCGCDGYGI